MAKQNENNGFTRSMVCNCATAPVWMTELFDGTDTASQRQAARAHLKGCAACERVWREWSCTRTLLRDVSVPPAPAQLREQVLLSCRLMPSQDVKAEAALQNEIAFEELARYISAPLPLVTSE